ncbi:MAG: hypothetical protein PVH00_13195 [Gemmatimonadota bacterium]|jgi:hypothetical protein
MWRAIRAPDTVPSVEALVEADVSRMYRADRRTPAESEAAGVRVGNLVDADVLRMYRPGPRPAVDSAGTVAGADVPPDILVEADVLRMYRTVGHTPRVALRGTRPAPAGVLPEHLRRTHPAEPRTKQPAATPDPRDVARTSHRTRRGSG